MAAEKAEKQEKKLALTDAVERIINNEDPGSVKALLGAVDDSEYKKFLESQRKIIDENTDGIVDALCERISAAKRVAVSCFLAEKPVHKPAREEQLIVKARKRCKENKTDPSMIEDIVRHTIIKARIAQDNTIGGIAKKLSEKGLLLSSQISSGRGTDFVIQPISTSMNDPEQILIREESNIKEFGIAGLTKKYSKNYRNFKKNFPWLKNLIEKEAVIGHRDYDLFIKEFENKEKSEILSFLPSKEMHIGYIRTAEILKSHQEIGLKINLSFNDSLSGIKEKETPDKKTPDKKTHGKETPDKEKKEKQKEILFNHILNLAALGLGINEKEFEVYIISNQKNIMELAIKISGEIPLSTVNSALGLSMSESPKSILCAFIEVADILGNEICFDECCECEKKNILAVSGLDKDLSVRFARDVSSEMGLPKPSSIYVRSVKPLSLNGSDNNFIYFSDGEKQIRDKIKHAITGGRESVELQKKFGGNPDPRICAVSSLLSFGLTGEEYKNTAEKCRSGEMMCGECKENCIKFFIDYVKKHSEKKEKLRDKVSGALSKINF